MGLAKASPIAKKPRRAEQKTVFLLTCGDRTAVRKRPAKGLLAGLWELPNVDGFLEPQPALELSAEPAVWKGRRFGNLVFAASDAPLPTIALNRRAAQSPFPYRSLGGRDLTSVTLKHAREMLRGK